MELNFALWKIKPTEIVKYIKAYNSGKSVTFDPKVSKRLIDNLIVGNQLTEEQAVKLLTEKFKFLQDERIQRLVDVLITDSQEGIVPFINERYINKDTILLCAAAFNSVKITALMIRNNANINVMDEDGWTPLITACVFGSFKVMYYLLSAGVDVNARSERYGTTALMVLVLKGGKDIITTFINHGADINIKNKKGEKAIALARLSGRDDIVEYLSALEA